MTIYSPSSSLVSLKIIAQFHTAIDGKNLSEMNKLIEKVKVNATNNENKYRAENKFTSVTEDEKEEINKEAVMLLLRTKTSPQNKSAIEKANEFNKELNHEPIKLMKMDMMNSTMGDLGIFRSHNTVESDNKKVILTILNNTYKQYSPQQTQEDSYINRFLSFFKGPSHQTNNHQPPPPNKTARLTHG